MKTDDRMPEGGPSVQEMRRQKKYWVKKMLELKEEETLLTLSGSHPAEVPIVNQAAFELPADLSERLRRMSGESSDALYLIMLAVLKCMVHKYTGGGSVTVACLQSKLQVQSANPEYNPSWLPVIDQPSVEKSFRDWLYEVKATYEAVCTNGNYPIDKVVQDMKVIHDRDYTFLQHIRISMKELHGNLDLKTNTKGLLVHFCSDNGVIHGLIAGQSPFFSVRAVESLAKHYIHILRELTSNPDRRVGECTWLSGSDRHVLLNEYASGNESPNIPNIMEMFETQVLRTPGASAVITPEQSMSYLELSERVNLWAKALVSSGLNPGEIIALYLDRSAETAVAVLAVMKAGGCVLPIDVQTPAERMNFILEDAAVTRLLTHTRYAEMPEFAGVEMILKSESLDEEKKSGSDFNFGQGVTDAYIIYTSGTTGKPKGVIVRHEGLANSIFWRKDEYRLSSQDRTMQIFSYSFDGFMTGFFTPLVSGASLFIPTESQVKDPLRLKQLIHVHRITHFICIPGLYQLLLEQMAGEEGGTLRMITLAGERLAPSLIRESLRRLPQVEIINEYGPTEASIVAAYKRNVVESAEIAIGRPIANMKAYILDGQLDPVPPGITGELCLSGPGLAAGYLNRPELTDEVFISHPFIPGERLYKTGDLAKWTDEGEICCLGRKDAQVKIRGYRIELSEIEQRLLAFPGIQAAAVLCLEEDGVPARLAAYLQCEVVQAKEIRAYMAGELPHYMLPSRYYSVERIPLSENGKTDKKALLLLDEPDDLDAEFIEPANETEQKLCEIFSDVLQIKRVSTEESFFDVGGHSLKATMLMSRIQKIFGVDIGIDDIFEKQTVKALASAIVEKGTKSYFAVTPAKPAAHYPLSSAQKRMYALFCHDPHSTAYNMPEALIIDGDLDRDRLERAVNSLAARHEILRTTFELVNGDPVQVVHEECSLKLDYNDEPPTNTEETIRNFVQPFDLESGPLLRIGISRMEDRKYLLLIDIHHIAADGASIGIIINELARLYNGDQLPEITVQYKDFSVWQQQRRNSNDSQMQENYWLKQFQDGIPVLDLPYDHPRPKFKSFEGARIHFTLDAACTSSLKKLAADHGATLFMLLLSVYNLMLSKVSGQEELVVGSPVSGRMQAELEETMGMFVNVVPIKNAVSSQLEFVQFLDQVKKSALGAFENQSFQYEELAHRLGYSRDTSRNPLFDVMFVLQNMPENRYDFRGLHFTHFAFEQTISKFDLTLAGFEGGDGVLYFDLEYSNRLFQRETVERFAAYFMHIIQAVIKQPAVRIGSITLLPVDILYQQTACFNASAEGELPSCTLTEQFTQLAALHPNRDALLFGEARLTYGQLNALSDRWTSWLELNGIGHNDVVAVRLERSFEMIVCFLAILKVGAVYLPIDPAFPAERVLYMLEDSGAVMLITDDLETKQIGFKGRTAFTYMVELPEHSAYIPVIKPQLVDLAYIIYTSGTTGRPKGVALEHAGLANLPEVFRTSLGVKPDDRILQFAPCSFDASVWEFAMALGTGGSLCLAVKETIGDPECFESYANLMGITVATFPPSYMERLQPDKLQSLRLVVTAGSEPSVSMLEEWSRHMRCINAYGPTEASVCAAMWEVENLTNHHKVPIGFPILNSRICIVDAGLNLLPAGITGELCIAGTGLAREYLNQPEMTSRQFVSSTVTGFQRMYRTGDLAKLLPNGNLIYQGRKDSQLKIRGYRVEPGEIEARMLQLNGVKSAAVLLKRQKDGNGMLSAFYSGETAPQPREMRILLSEGLPEYMIPSVFSKLDSLPLTLHGKVDAAALIRLPQSEIHSISARPPVNDLEAQIIEVFEEVLERKEIGADDCFNEIGGDSISAMKAVFLLKRKGLSMEVRDLLIHQSAGRLGEMLQQRLGEDSIAVATLPVTGGRVTSESTQPGIEESKAWSDLLHDLAYQQNVYARQISENPFIGKIPFTAIQAMHLGRSENIGTVINLSADRSREEIESSVLNLVHDQEMLRCFLPVEDDKSWCLYEQPTHLSLPFIRLSGLHAEEQMKQLILEVYNGRFDYDIPGSLLYRLVLIENAVSGAKVLVYASHHSLSDGLTCGLIRELLSHPYTSSPSGSNGKIGYRDYFHLLEEGPQEITLNELEHNFNLPVFRRSLLELESRVNLFSASHPTVIELEFPLNGELPEEGWHTVLEVLAAFGRDFLQLEQMPVQLVSGGRRYGNHTFYHLAGNFIDYIPLVVNVAEPAGHNLNLVRELTQAASTHHINFAAMDIEVTGKTVLVNYFGAIQKEEISDWTPENSTSFEETAAHYGICFYVRHIGSCLRIDIALPFEADADGLKQLLSGNSVPGILF
ncbi:amino acid adenylation domain-containing protein [Paenibacillus sp. sgz500958]|uniref:amino acid adenylation domain-containing protein n=1 Tax=Paenibacillus sp. sgz500958 TaxID=3242475 RepID=UPI0036D29591